MRANKLLERLKQVCAITVFLVLTNLSVTQANAANLTDIVYSKLSGDNVQINFIADGELAEPGSFSTDQPARIALDFFGLKNQLDSPRKNIGLGKVESVLAVETEDRTRLIINLNDTARFRLLPIENGYSVTIFNTQEDASEVTSPKPFAAQPDVVSSTKITNIDFRRSELGGGKLIVDLNDDNVTVDTRERDGEIIVDLLGVHVPASLEQRLDVVDFATPVQTVDSFQNSDNVRLVIVPKGDYQHLSFQSGNRFTLVVDPIIETEEDLRNEEDAVLGFEGERLSINFQKIDVRSALAVIADFTGINFVTSDSVQGDITINLKDVPWDQALDVILRTRGLSKRQTGNVMWVAPSAEIQEFEQKELEANASVEKFAPLVTEVIRVNYAKAADISEVIKSVRVLGQKTSGGNSDIETDKNSLLSSRGSVTVDARTNSLLVQDVAEKIMELRKVVAKLDKPVRQVLIETRIVEANDNFSRELGARLGFQRITEAAQFPGSSSEIGNIIQSGSIAGNTFISESDPLEFDRSTGQPGGLAVDLGASSIAGAGPASYAFDIFRAGTGYSNLITLELSALESDGRGRIVASPRLLTSNQKEARISQGSEIFVSVPGGASGSGTLEKIEAELTLIVTPQITPDDRVILDVEITQDNLITLGAEASVIGTKQIETQVLADNGETVVIGGIYQEDESDGETKVPLLGNIPVLGHLFKKKSRRSNRTELLIFLTPKIISPKLNLG